MNEDAHVMLAFLPEDPYWARQDLPHLTLVYAGKQVEHSAEDFIQMSMAARWIGEAMTRFSLKVTEPDVYGSGTDENPYVDVFKLQPSSELVIARSFVEEWNKSEHLYSPHVTVGPQGTIAEQEIRIPSTITFNQVCLAWGPRRIKYPLKY